MEYLASSLQKEKSQQYAGFLSDAVNA